MEKLKQMTEIKTLFSKEDLQKRIAQLGEELNEYYKNADELVVICVLKGASMFFVDLVKELKIPVKYEFIKLSSYGNEQKSSHAFREISMNISDLTNKNVLLVEDIVDSGFTLAFLNKYFQKKYQMKSYKTIALLNKSIARDKDCNIDADFYGFEVDDKFVLGYGLDYEGLYRNLDYIGYFEN